MCVLQYDSSSFQHKKKQPNGSEEPVLLTGHMCIKMQCPNASEHFKSVSKKV